MKTLLKSLALAAFLSFGVHGFAAADVVESTETDDVLDAVGEVTSSLVVANRGTPISVFVSGTYSADAWLQREIGSPGSGSWENVVEVTGADNANLYTAWQTESDNTSWRVYLSAFTSGDVVAQLTDQPLAPQTFAGDAYVIHEDDFFVNTAAIDANYYVTAENDATGTVCVVTVTIQEGGVTCISGTGDDGADEVAFSLIDLTDDGALVSDGWTAVEWNIQLDQIDGQSGFGLHDEEATASQIAPFDVDSNVVTFDTANQADGVFWVQQGEATNSTSWIPVCANTDAECVNSDEYATAETVVASTYVRLRIEVQSNGDCYFYIDGGLVYAENECVATTARLIPFAWVNTTAAAPGATTVIIDQLKFVMARPTA